MFFILNFPYHRDFEATHFHPLLFNQDAGIMPIAMLHSHKARISDALMVTSKVFLSIDLKLRTLLNSENSGTSPFLDFF